MVLKFEPWGEDPICDWDDENEAELWAHRIRYFEVDECFDNAHTVVPHRKSKSKPEKYGDRYEIRGHTDGGRKLFIVVQHLAANWVRPITAWDDD